MDDRQMIDLLFLRDDTGLRLIQEQYARLYKDILRQTLSSEADVEECANDVLLAIWNSIPPNCPSHLASYICRIARRIGINRYKHNTRQKRGAGYTVLLSELGGCIPAAQEPDLPRADLRRILSDFLKGLDPQTRVLFLRRYYYLESVKSLARRFAIRENAISVKLHRARKQLKIILGKEGISV